MAKTKKISDPDQSMLRWLEIGAAISSLIGTAGLIALLAVFDHADKFRVAYAGVPVSDIVARMGYTTQDYRDEFSAKYHLGKTANQDVDEYRRRSPAWNASTAGATPKETVSEIESYSAPKRLSLPVMRAARPSRQCVQPRLASPPAARPALFRAMACSAR